MDENSNIPGASGAEPQQPAPEPAPSAVPENPFAAFGAPGPGSQPAPAAPSDAVQPAPAAAAPAPEIAQPAPTAPTQPYYDATAAQAAQQPYAPYGQSAGAGQSRFRGKRLRFLFVNGLDLSYSLVHGSHEDVRKRFGIVGIDHLGRHFDSDKLFFAVHFDLHGSAARRYLIFARLKLLGQRSHVVLKFLILAHERVHVCGSATADALRYSCFHFSVLSLTSG